MIFTIEAEQFIVKNYRLQRNGMWRSLHKDFALQENDQHILSLPELEMYCRNDQNIDIEGKKYRANPSTSIDFGDKNVVFVHPRLFRFERPALPQKKDLMEKIAQADQRKLYSPIIDLQGNIDLRDRDRKNPVHDYSIAVRAESITDDYLGLRASHDGRFIRNTYTSLLEGWLTHLDTGKLNIFMDFGSGESEQSLLRKIQMEMDTFPEGLH